MEENSRLENHCHISNSFYNTLINGVRETRREAQTKQKAQSNNSVFCANWAVRTCLVPLALEKIVNNSLRYLDKF